MDRQLKLTDSAIIDLLGGTARVARMCKCDLAAVSNWRVRGIPAAKYMFLGARIEEASHGLVTRQDIFPTSWHLVWPELLPKHNAFGAQNDE